MMARAALTLCLLCLYSFSFSAPASAASPLRFSATSPYATGSSPHATIDVPPGAITVLPDAPTVGEAFGSAIALDGNTLVVGAPGADVGDNEQPGVAYVFARTGDNQWQQVRRITASDGNAFDGFGTAVAIHGDIIVVGAAYAEITPDETNQGAAYVFARNEGGADNWGQVTKLFGSLGDRLDNFGSAVVVHGDDIFVAAANQGNGMVYHYRRDLGGEDQWGEAQQLFDAEGRQNDNYGSALAFDGATLGYAAYIERNTSRFCVGSDGYFQIETGRLVLCLAPGSSVNESAVAALIHEYFHATQYGYSQVYQDYQNGDKEDWVIEGMAAAAEESYYLDQGLRRSDDFGLHHVDIPFTSNASTDEYRAQDFWVYVGKRLSGSDVNLGYFKSILRYGASLAAVDEGLRQHFNTNFKDQLWDWTSNQIIEKEETLDNALGDACVLEQAALQFGIQYPWNLLPAPQTSYWPTGGGNATVPPYTTMVVQLIFPYNSPAQNVILSYPECENNTDYDAWVQCNRNAQERLPAQMYAEHLPGCFDDDQGRLLDPAFNSTTFRPVERNRRYFAVVTNVTDSDQVFKLVAELGGP